MLRIDRTQKSLARLDEKPLPEAGLAERADIQQMIRNSPDAFFGEMGERLLLVGEEVRPADFVDDRIDLLAIDQQGASVIIEIKRGAHKLQLLQALSYAAMVSKWDASRIIEERRHLANQSEEVTEEEVERFILEDLDDLNWTQRIILIAEGFDYSLLITAEWLSEAYELDIRCYRIALSTDGQAEYLACTCIYPPPEITEHAKRRGGGGPGRKTVKWKDWDEALSQVDNPAVVSFFRSEIDAGRENNLGRKRYLAFRIDGKRRYFVMVRKKNAYVWQIGRFDGDVNFWGSRLVPTSDPQPVKDGKALRFYLTTKEDFAAFHDANSGELTSVGFFSTDEMNELDVDG